jgi:hypothetical protein
VTIDCVNAALNLLSPQGTVELSQTPQFTLKNCNLLP